MNSERRGSTASNGGTKRRGSVIVTLPGGRVHRIMHMPLSDCMVPTRFWRIENDELTRAATDGVKPGDWFRTEDRNGTEFAFQLPEGVSGGQKVEVEVPGEKKSTVVKVC